MEEQIETEVSTEAQDQLEFEDEGIDFSNMTVLGLKTTPGIWN